MNSLFSFFASETWSEIVFSLLHSLWIGVVFVGLLGITLRCISVHRPQLRYFTALGALIGLVVSAFVAYAAQQIDWNAKPVHAAAGNSERAKAAHDAGGLINPSTADKSPSGSSVTQTALTPFWIPFAAAVWLAGAALMLVRMVLQFSDLRKVFRSVRLVEDLAILNLAGELAERLKLRRAVQIATSPLVHAPCVFGFLYPTILFPVSMMSGVPVEQLRAIIAHEMAHIRRHDYIINIVQQLVEALLFFNPAVWWINRQIRIEREACCDLMAIKATGERGIYARALTDWAERLSSPEAGLQMQPAFAGENRPSGLLDRIKRLLMPDYRPAVRLPWYSFMGVILVCAVILFGTWRGSLMAVAKAAEWLTPEQRIEKLAEIQSAHNTELPGGEYTDADRISISGQMLTDDGSSLPVGAGVRLRVTRRGSTYMSGLNVRNGRFQGKVEFGRIYLTASAKGYAPTVVGPLETMPGGSIQDIQIRLKNGFPTTVRVTDAQGNPLAGVQLKANYEEPVVSDIYEFVTNEDGTVRLEHLSPIPMKWTASIPGYQYDERSKVVLKADEILEWKLSPTKVTAGVVVDSATGQPIPGAQFKLIHRSAKFPFNTDIRSAPIIARTGPDGTFGLSNLVDHAEHAFILEKEGFAPKLVSGIMSGQANQQIELSPEIIVRGTVTGDLSQLRQFDGKPILDVANPLKLGNSTHSYSRPVPVLVDNGTGHFEIRELLAGRMDIRAGVKLISLDVEKSISDLRIELSPPADATPNNKRELIVRVRVPIGLPAAKGSLRILGDAGETNHKKWISVPLTNGEARIVLSVPNRTAFESAGLVGYWLPDESNIEVPVGSGPFILERPAISAGAIHGKIVNAKGEEIKDAFVSVVEVKKAPGKPNSGGLHSIGRKSISSNEDRSAAFSAQPLPLGGEYVLVAHRKYTFEVSKVLALTEANPIQEITMVLPEGISVEGVVKDTKGQLLEKAKIDFGYQTPYAHGFGVGDSVVTDSSGRFKIEGINPNIIGSYHVSVEGLAGYQPMRKEVKVGQGSVTFFLEEGASLSGVVLNNATGKPLAGAEVYVIPKDPKSPGDYTYRNAESPTDKEGKFKFSNLQKREYWLHCRSGAIVTGDRITVTAGQDKPVTLRIQPHKGEELWEDGKLVRSE